MVTVLTREMPVLKKDYTVHNTNQFIRFCCVKASQEEQIPTGEDNEKMKSYWKRRQVLVGPFQTQENIRWGSHVCQMQPNQSVTNHFWAKWLSCFKNCQFWIPGKCYAIQTIHQLEVSFEKEELTSQKHFLLFEYFVCNNKGIRNVSSKSNESK